MLHLSFNFAVADHIQHCLVASASGRFCIGASSTDGAVLIQGLLNDNCSVYMRHPSRQRGAGEVGYSSREARSDSDRGDSSIS